MMSRTTGDFDIFHVLVLFGIHKFKPHHHCTSIKGKPEKNHEKYLIAQDVISYRIIMFVSSIVIIPMKKQQHYISNAPKNCTVM